MDPFYPEFISGLPEADIPFNGVRGWLSQGKDHQIVFFEIEPIGEVAPHSHGAQWGVVFEGEMEFTIGGRTRTYRKGDHYFIPEGVIHSAVFKTKTWAMDFFADADRYQTKPEEDEV
ncbi:MAG: cupin domain-containing protein [Bacteroidales bacterium]|nr:cupin domain-containing protein [Bacteroidales bacterium]